MKRIILILAALALFAGSAEAATTYANVVNEIDNQGAMTPMKTFYNPAALASGDTVHCTFNAQRLINWNNDGGVATTSIVYGWNSFTAAESVSVNFAVGWTATGPWITVYEYNLQTNTLTGTIGYEIKSDVAATTLLPLPYHRYTYAAKATIAAGTKFFMGYPQTGFTNRPYMGR